MLSEQQQRIMGYFIEEAKDHLNTIEQGLLKLQGTIEDPEMVSEVFRAAHSVKGGAAMLGLGSIQRTAHRLEDFFKVLKECPIQVDQRLETLFLNVFDALKEQLDQLQGPFGLTDDKASEIMTGVEPVFGELGEHLSMLVSRAGGVLPEEVQIATIADAIPRAAQPVFQLEPNVQQPAEEISTLQLIFQNNVPMRLREMLQLFKQSDNATSRQQLQDICQTLSQAGDQFGLPAWSNVVEMARRTIANFDNPYRALAPVVIRDLKQAQDLVLAGRSTEVSPSDSLIALIPPEQELDIDEEIDFANLLAEMELAADDDTAELIDFELDHDIEISESIPESSISVIDVVVDTVDSFFDDGDWFTDAVTQQGEEISSLNLELPDTESTTSTALPSAEGFEQVLPATQAINQTGPEVGIAELNSLADLFEGEVADLGLTWQEEEIIGISTVSSANLEKLDTSNDFSDLLFEQDNFEQDNDDLTLEEDIADEDLSELLNNLTNGEQPLESIESLETAASDTDSLASDLFATENFTDETADPTDLLSDFSQPDGTVSSVNDPSPMVAFSKQGDSKQEIREISFFSAAESDFNRTDDAEDLSTLFTDLNENDLGAIVESDNLFPAQESMDVEAILNLTEEEATFIVDQTDPFGGLPLQELSEDELELGDRSFTPTSKESIEILEDTLDDALLDSLFLDIPLDVTTAASADEEPQTTNDITPISDSWMSEDNNAAVEVTTSPSDSFFQTQAELTFDLWADIQDSEEFTIQPDEGFHVNMDLETADIALDEVDNSVSVDFAPEFVSDLVVETVFDGDLNNLFRDDVTAESSAEPFQEFSDLGELSDAVVDLAAFFEDDEQDFSIDASLMDGTVDGVIFQNMEDVGFPDILESLDFAEHGFDLEGASELDLQMDGVASDEEFFTADFDVDSVSDAEAAISDLGLDFNGLDLSIPGLEESAFADDLSVSMTPVDRSSQVESIPISPEDAVSEFEAEEAEVITDFSDLKVVLSHQDTGTTIPKVDSEITENSDAFADLETLLGEARLTTPAPSDATDIEDERDFADLEALLAPEILAPSSFAPSSSSTIPSSLITNNFDDLEKLLEDADQTLGGSPTSRGVRGPALVNNRRTTRRGPGVLTDQTMRVSVKNLDNLNNLVGELVVNRNSLEQAEERLRQFLDNLLYQVQQLSDVGQRMRDLYERSLLESSLLSSRKSYHLSSPGITGFPNSASSHATGISFDALEMDRFTGFHTLSQEMIELIVRVRESASDIDFVVDETDQVTRNLRQITTQLQEGLTRSRMVPFAQTADRLPRAVRDIALKCGKQAELIIEGRETLIDKMILEQLYDPMTHLVNNAITHGIETAEERIASGKPPVGRITVRTFHQGNQTVIAVTDDGAGIDPQMVKQKAVEKGLITPAQAQEMTRLDVHDLLFHHGFSTRDKADDFAGRGVGMDVVRTSLNEIRGVINIDSTVGRGTTFTIRLPLTLSISKALCCISNRARIAFPMDGVEDMLDIPKDRIIKDNQDRPCIQWRDTLLPFRPLSELLQYNRSLGRGSVYGGNQEDDIVSVVVLRSAGNFLALQVDQVLGEQEIVIKQLEGPVPKPVGVAGATVLGDGRIMPIADVLELIDLSMGRIRRDVSSSLWEKDEDHVPPDTVNVKTEPTVLIVDDSITVRELLSMTFNKIGYRVEQARDGQEAWEKLRSGLPCDLVFCDIEMPRMDGLELLSRIQKDSNLNHLPIAMLTSRGADRHRQMAIQLGAKGYFTKPYLEEALLDAAQRMLKGEVLVTNG